MCLSNIDTWEEIFVTRPLRHLIDFHFQVRYFVKQAGKCTARCLSTNRRRKVRRHREDRPSVRNGTGGVGGQTQASPVAWKWAILGVIALHPYIKDVSANILCSYRTCCAASIFNAVGSEHVCVCELDIRCSETTTFAFHRPPQLLQTRRQEYLARAKPKRESPWKS